MIESTLNKLAYNVGTARVFPFPIRFFDPGDIKCYIYYDSLERQLTASEFAVENKTDYSNGANITLLIQELPATAVLVISRYCSLTQQLNLPQNGKLPSTALEHSLDKLTMIAQQQQEELSRCLKSSISGEGNAPEDLIMQIQNSAAAANQSATMAAEATKTASAAAKTASTAAETASAAAETASAAAKTAENAEKNIEVALASRARTDLANVDTNLDFVVDTWRSGTSWYRKYRSGWVEQGGFVAQGDSPIVTLPVEMADTDYWAMGQSQNDSNTTAALHDLQIHSKTATTLKVGYTGWVTAYRDFIWIVCGKGATE